MNQRGCSRNHQKVKSFVSAGSRSFSLPEFVDEVQEVIRPVLEAYFKVSLLHVYANRTPGKAAIFEAERFRFEPGPEFTLDAFQKYVDHLKAQYFKQNKGQCEPLLENIEGEYWRMVEKPMKEIKVAFFGDLSLFSSFGNHVGCITVSSFLSFLCPYFPGWNLNNFPRLPGSVLAYESSDISGVLVPWLHIGMNFSSFYWINLGDAKISEGAA
ncbi:hypothetical protein T459_14791 [Capsicum annuum]|uniref:Uncharacterized protein n=1 Tax=Capsicum annuum TaxID=4072 RepID=A0A2G2ZIH2_CAPAN|nr:hypothetical protein T459_14791 [Capsicum annuum]